MILRVCSYLQELQAPVLHERSARLNVVRKKLCELPQHVLLHLHRAISQERLQGLIKIVDKKRRAISGCVFAIYPGHC